MRSGPKDRAGPASCDGFNKSLYIEIGLKFFNSFTHSAFVSRLTLEQVCMPAWMLVMVMPIVFASMVTT